MPSSPFALVAGLPPTVRLLVLGTFINKLGSFIIPFLTLVLRREFRMSEAETGAAIFAYGIGSIVSIMTGGYLSDHLGRRRTLLISLLGGGTLAIALGFAPNVATFSALLLVFGFIADLYRPASSAIVGDMLDPASRPVGFAALRVAINLGFAIGVALGGFVADWSWRALFWGDGVTTLVFGFVVYRFIGETRPAEARAARISGTAPSPWRDRVYLWTLASSLIFSLVFFADITILPLTVTESAGYPSRVFGLLLATNGVLVGILEVPAAHALRGFRRLRVAALGMGVAGLGLVLTGLRMHWGFFLVAIVVWTIGEVLTMPQHMSFVADWAPAESRGTYLGLYSATWALGLSCNPILLLPLHERLGEPFFWTLVGLVNVVPMAICLSLDRTADRPGALAGVRATLPPSSPSALEP